MPASLYRLVGKPHHAEVVQREPEVVQTPVQPQEQLDQVVESPSILETFASQIEDASSTQTNEESVEVTDVSETTDSSTQVVEQKKVSPTWDPSWSKTQLLAVAKELGLNVTSINTRNEIIAALSSSSPS